MRITTLIKAFILATSIGITSAAPVSNDLVSRQTLGVPSGQGALLLLDSDGNAVGCIEFATRILRISKHPLLTYVLRYRGHISSHPTSSDCYRWFNADEYSDGKSAAFGNQAGPCTFYPFTDNSYNYTCSEESIAQDYVESTFQVRDTYNSK